MALSAEFVSAVLSEIIGRFSGDLIEASAKAVQRKFKDPEVRAAFEAALHTAIERALAETEVPRKFAEAEGGAQHFADVLGGFLRSDLVVEELSHLIDPRPGFRIDTEALVATFSKEYRKGDFRGLDLAAFLRLLAQQFYVAASQNEKLQGVIEIRLLGEIAVGVETLAGLAARSVAAVERSALANERTADGIQELRQTVALAIEGRPVPSLYQNIQVFIGQGPAAALAAYEVVVSLLHRASYDVLGLEDDALEIRRDSSAEDTQTLPALGELRGAAEALRRALLGSSPSDEDLDQMEARYRQHLIRWFENLTFQGMMRTPKPIVLSLEDVYVELRAVAEVPEGADAFSVDERRLLLELEERDLDGRDRELRRELLGQLDALRRERWSRTLPERKSMAEALHRADQRAFVILGDPGSGKTTLLHYLALTYARGADWTAEKLRIPPLEAERLPIFVPLAAYDDMRRRRADGLSLKDFLAFYYDVRRGLPGLGPLFERALGSGRALVLLDGLDEVLETSTRRYVAEQVSALVGEWVPRGVRFALSSRVVGYREAPVTAPVATLTVLDFGQREIETFVRKWVQAFEKWAAGGESPEMLRQARDLERDLMSDVRSNAGVRRLAANPLMLTMLALLRRQIGRLPHRRIQLYESYVGTLLENWVELRTAGAREEKVERLERTDAESILIPLALWLQQEKPSGTAGRAELREQLTGICLREQDLALATATAAQRKTAEQRADRFLREMREMTGLLVERGQDAFGFLHLTFQEYFAGRALAALDDAARWEAVRGHLHDPRWREPILLCAGRLGVIENRRAQVTAFVRSIFEHEDPTEPDLRRNLQLALTIACDDVYLEHSLVERLVEAAVGLMPTGVYALDRALMDLFAQVVANGATTLETCFGPVWRSTDGRWRREAIEALARFVDFANIQETILKRLMDSDTGVVAVSLNALSSIAGMAEQLKAQLLENINAGSPGVRKASISALAPLAEKDLYIQNTLLEKFNDDAPEVRQAAASVFQLLAQAVPHIRSALLEKLHADDWRVRHTAILSLAPLGLSDVAVRDVLFEKLHSADWAVWPHAISTLARLALITPQIEQNLLDKFFDKEPDTRRLCVEALAPFVHNSPHLVNAFLSKLKDSSWSVRDAAVAALAPAVNNSKQVRDTVLALIHDDSWGVRHSVIQALAPMALSDLKVREALFNKLTDNVIQVRLLAATFFLNRQAMHYRAVAVCLEALGLKAEAWPASPGRSAIRRDAALLLGKVEAVHYDERIYTKLLQVMKTDEDTDVRDAAYGALVRLALAREQAAATAAPLPALSQGCAKP